MKPNIRTFISIISVIVAVIIFRSSAFGQQCQLEHYYYWVAGPGDWSIPENWEHNAWDPTLERCMDIPGVPGTGDWANISNGGTAIITCNTEVTNLFLGTISDPGTLIQTGGDLNINGYLAGGGLFLSSGGRYELQQGSLNAHSIFNDGGTFDQSGGNVILNGYPTEGYLFLEGQGKYELRQGSFKANTACIGIDTPGTFVQTGGNAILGHLDIDGHGTYELHQGSAVANRVSVSSEGTFIQTGGSVTVKESLGIGEGTYELLGGTINTPSILVGYPSFESKDSGSASFIVNGGVINGTSESDYYAIRVYGNRGSLTGPGTFNIPVVYESEEIYSTSGNRSLDVTFGRNCLAEGGAYSVKQLTPSDFADGNVPNLLESSVFEVSFDGLYCGEFEIAIPYDWNELEALDMCEENLVIVHETGPKTYERLEDTIARLRQGIAKAKAHTFGKFAVAYYPRVILVHGWRTRTYSGLVSTWEFLIPKLEEKGIPYYEFNYLPATGDPRMYANWLNIWVGILVRQLFETTGYTGKFDIVCHSMGAMVSRLYMEKMDGDRYIRQWIGIAPVNHGADLANVQPFFLPWLRSFFPFLIGTEEAITQMKTNSPTVRWLNSGGPSPDVLYRVIAGLAWPEYLKEYLLFGGSARGLTLREQRRKAKEWVLTHLGDGIVPLERSLLEGAQVDCFIGLGHNDLLESNTVCERVVKYLLSPLSLNSQNNIPSSDAEVQSISFGSNHSGTIAFGESYAVTFTVDSSTQRVIVTISWSGSNINMSLISPNGVVIDANSEIGIYYDKTDNTIWYEFDAFDNGEWTAIIEAVDVPPEGEPFDFMTFYLSPLTLEVTTTEDRTYYHQGDLVNIKANCTDGNTVIVGSTITATFVSPNLITDNLALYDDGSHGDGEAKDGYYSNDYLLLEEGAYQITIAAHGTFDGSPFERTMPMTIWVTSEEVLTYDTKADWK